MSDDALKIIGQKISHYSIESYLGAGNAGHVYRALDVRAHGFVALKIYKDWLFEKHPQIQDRRIAREFQIRHLRNPNLCRVHEHGEQEIAGLRRRYLVMELVEGLTLEEEIASHGPWSWANFQEVALQLIQALHSLHQAGFVHRDVKPSNIVLDSNPPSSQLSGPDAGQRKVSDHESQGSLTGKRKGTRAVLLDFGVIGDLDEATELTNEHEFLGTIRYSAPEWLLRSPPDAYRNPAVDVYSLGGVFHDLMTGRRLFADRLNRFQLALDVPRQIPDLRTQGFPPSVVAMVRRMLAKSPRHRPSLADCEEVVSSASLTSSPLDGLDDPIAQFRVLAESRDDWAQKAKQIDGQRAVSEQLADLKEAIWNQWRETDFQEITDLPYMKGLSSRPLNNLGQWTNGREVRDRLPDQQLTSGFEIRFEGMDDVIGVHTVYFTEIRLGKAIVTRFVATCRSSIHGSRKPGEIDPRTVEVWVGPLEEVRKTVLRDVEKANGQLRQLLVRANRSSL